MKNSDSESENRPRKLRRFLWLVSKILVVSSVFLLCCAALVKSSFVEYEELHAEAESPDHKRVASVYYSGIGPPPTSAFKLQIRKSSEPFRGKPWFWSDTLIHKDWFPTDVYWEDNETLLISIWVDKEYFTKSYGSEHLPDSVDFLQKTHLKWSFRGEADYAETVTALSPNRIYRAVVFQRQAGNAKGTVTEVYVEEFARLSLRPLPRARILSIVGDSPLSLDFEDDNKLIIQCAECSSDLVTRLPGMLPDLVVEVTTGQ